MSGRVMRFGLGCRARSEERRVASHTRCSREFGSHAIRLSNGIALQGNTPFPRLHNGVALQGTSNAAMRSKAARTARTLIRKPL